MSAVHWIYQMAAHAAIATIALPAAVCAPEAAHTTKAMQQEGNASPTAAFGEPLGASQLSDVRGTGGVAMTTTIGGTVSANSASQVSTGDNLIQAGSFAGASGVPVVIQNTGANVLIQNATVIHLELQ